MSTPYTLGYHYGVPMDNLTKAAFEAGLAKVPAHIRSRLRVTQGAPSGAAASAGTHNGRGAIDIIISGGTWAEYRTVENAFRSVGWAFWFRSAIPGTWPTHAHGLVVGHPYLSPGAYQQTLSYRRGRNGLRGDGDDPNNYNPHVIYKYRSNDMALSKKDTEAIARAVWRYEMSGTGSVPRESAGERLRQIRATKPTPPTRIPDIPSGREIAADVWSYNRDGDKRDASQILVDTEKRVATIETGGK